MGAKALKMLQRDAVGRVSYRVEQREAILDEFERSGPGLHIARWIVQRRARDIAVVTGPDRLTRAAVRLPREGMELSSGPAPEGTLLDLLDTLAALEQQVKAIRAALATAVLDAKEKRRAAAVACENTDRRDEPLVSVGWSLHRGPGPAATMPPPATMPSSPPAHRPHRGTEHKLKRRPQPEVLRSSGHPGR